MEENKGFDLPTSQGRITTSNIQKGVGRMPSYTFLYVYQQIAYSKYSEFNKTNYDYHLYTNKSYIQSMIINKPNGRYYKQKRLPIK